MSIVCEAFQCPPDVAARQNWRTVSAIMDYRLAIAARDQHQEDATKMTPDMVRLWTEMIKAAQDG